MVQALALSEQNKEAIRADKLQKLHTLHNLAQLLKEGLEGLPGVPPTLRDSTLETEAQSLRDGYLAESIAKLAVADKEYQDALDAMNTAAGSCNDPGTGCPVWQRGMATPNERWVVTLVSRTVSETVGRVAWQILVTCVMAAPTT